MKGKYELSPLPFGPTPGFHILEDFQLTGD